MQKFSQAATNSQARHQIIIKLHDLQNVKNSKHMSIAKIKDLLLPRFEEPE